MTSYYVYELIDPRDGAVFYVGKGKGARISAHERQARCGVQSAKCDRIRAIIASGHAVRTRIVQRFESEVEAYKFEAAHVARIGREALTNMRDGGFGGRIRFGAEVDRETARDYLGYIAQWARMGSPSRLNFVGDKALDLIPIIEAYKAKVDAVAARIGWDAVREEARKHNITVELVDATG